MSIHYEGGYGGKPSPITIMTNLHHLRALIPSQKGRQAPIRPKMALWLRRQALYSHQRPLERRVQLTHGDSSNAWPWGKAS